YRTTDDNRPDREIRPRPPGARGSELGRGRFGLGEALLDEIEAAIPEARVAEIDVDDRAKLLRCQRAAGAEHLEVSLLEAGALGQVALVDRQREQLAVGVRV